MPSNSRFGAFEGPSEIRIVSNSDSEARHPKTEIIDTSKLNHFLDFVFDSFGFKLVVYTVFFGVTLVPLGAIVIGTLYFSHEDCPADEAVSPSLIVTGLMAVIVSCLDLVILRRREKVRMQRETRREFSLVEDEDDADSLASDDDEGPSFYKIVQIKRKTKCLIKTSNVLKFLELAVFIYACSIVFKLYPSVQFDDPNSFAETFPDYYCNKVLYLYAFWSLTSTLVLLGLVILSLCFLGFYS